MGEHRLPLFVPGAASTQAIRETDKPHCCHDCLSGALLEEIDLTNRIFAALANQTIDSFASGFVALSAEIFYDQETKRLRHPGEFGAFRERLCADFLTLFIPSYLKVGSGFLINGNDEVSTQCDLVIYDGQYTPMITDAQNARFFPVETIVCIGEVKSKLAKRPFLDALVKLATNKSLRSIHDKSIAPRSPRILTEEERHHFDMTASVLICEQLDFPLDNMTAEISAHYEANNIPVECRHNLILSIRDGIFCYANHLVARNIAWMYPVTRNERMKNRLVFPGDSGRNHFDIFTAYIFTICTNATIYQPNIGDYVAKPSQGLYQDEL